MIPASQRNEIKQLYDALLSKEHYDGESAELALSHLGVLIDLACDFGDATGLQKAVQLSDQLFAKDLSPDETCLAHYFVANAWSGLRMASSSETPDFWEHAKREKEIFHLKSATTNEGFGLLPSLRRAQILTNLANMFSSVGRCVEAIECWDKALEALPDFDMALGNKGMGLVAYASGLRHSCEQYHFITTAGRILEVSCQSDKNRVGEAAMATFNQYMSWIDEQLARLDVSEQPRLEEFQPDFKKAEDRYCHWCLSKRLFLNPINDLGPYAPAATDNLMISSVTTSLDEGPSLHGFFNQLKQEFVSARYLYYEGTTSDSPHFSDRGVLLVNTMDYPVYSLAIEQIKMAFRISYSLLDKIGFFLNAYLAFGIPQNQVSFRSLWYARNEKKKGLRAELLALSNWPLRGLFWLSKDIYESKPGFRDATDPRAETLAIVRNFLEHKYFKLHDGMVAQSDESFEGLKDQLAFSLSRTDFDTIALQLLKTARAAIIYLFLAIVSHEASVKEQHPEEVTLPMFLGNWKDDWKR